MSTKEKIDTVTDMHWTKGVTWTQTEQASERHVNHNIPPWCLGFKLSHLQWRKHVLHYLNSPRSQVVINIFVRAINARVYCKMCGNLFNGKLFVHTWFYFSTLQAKGTTPASLSHPEVLAHGQAQICISAIKWFPVIGLLKFSTSSVWWIWWAGRTNVYPINALG